VATDPNALGYFGFGYYKKNSQRLKALKVVNPKGNPIAPSVASVQKELYQPLSRPLFLYVNDKTLTQNKAFRSFVTSYLRHAQSLVEKADYIPLPPRTYRLVESKLYRHILGTSFGGTIPVGLTIGQVLERSFDQHKKPSYR
jgi:phosphate transport system substrate-binding protein